MKRLCTRQRRIGTPEVGARRRAFAAGHLIYTQFPGGHIMRMRILTISVLLAAC